MATTLLCPPPLPSRTLPCRSSIYSLPSSRSTSSLPALLRPLSVVPRSASGKWARQASSSSPGVLGFSVENYEEEEEVGEGVALAPPPIPGRIDIVVTKEQIRQLDLSPAHDVFRKYVHQIGDNTTDPAEDPQELFDRTVGFVLDCENNDTWTLGSFRSCRTSGCGSCAWMRPTRGSP